MKNSRKSHRRNGIGLVSMIFVASLCLFTACGEEQKPTKLEDMASDMSSINGADDEETLRDDGKRKETEADVNETPIPDGQIPEQSFEVELDGWGKVTFASFEPEVTTGDNNSPYGDARFIDSMAVDDKYRGMGIGHLFFEKVKQIKEQRNLDGIELQVNAKNNAAYEMYAKFGFTEKSINMELL